MSKTYTRKSDAPLSDRAKRPNYGLTRAEIAAYKRDPDRRIPPLNK